MVHPENAKRLPKAYPMMLSDGTTFLVLVEWQAGNDKYKDPTLWLRVMTSRGKQLGSFPLRDLAQVNEFALAIEGIAGQIEADKAELPKPAKVS